MNPPRTPPHLRLVDRQRRIVELWAPRSPVSTDPTDRELYVDPVTSLGARARPVAVAHCYEGHGRRARFLVDQTPAGDQLLTHLASRRFPITDATPYGAKGWAVEV